MTSLRRPGSPSRPADGPKQMLGITLEGGLVGIWSAAVVDVVLLLSAMVWKFSTGDWKAIKL